MPPPPNAPDVTFAISKLFLGDTDRDGTPNKVSGWKQYGFDLDHKISTALSVDLCIPRKNAPVKTVYPDGNNGIDNAFGKNILPMFLGLSSTFSADENARITKGEHTLLFHVQKLGPDIDYNPLLGREYAGANLGQPPKFDGSDTWPVNPASLVNPADIMSAKTQFPQSYLTANTWVGIAQGDLDFSLAVLGASAVLPIKHAIVTMDLSLDHKAAQNGTIAGVITVNDFVAYLKKAAGTFDPSLCSGPTIDSILAQLEQAADILADTSQDPTKLCDAISIGLGFDAKVVKLGAIAPPVMPSPDPCAP